MAPKTLIRVIWCPSAYDSWAFGTLLKNEKKRRPLKPNTMTHIDENIQSQNYSLKSSLSLFSCWISGFTQRKCGLCSQGSSLLASILKYTAIIRWPPRRRDRFVTSFLGPRPRLFHPLLHPPPPSPTTTTTTITTTLRLKLWGTREYVV